MARLLRGIKLILKISKTGPLGNRLDHNDKNPTLDHQTHLKTDEQLEELVRDRVETLYHPTSTCRMAPLEQGGVVDSKLRVYGVKGLRVCDASIFPEIVSGHTVSSSLLEKTSIFTKPLAHYTRLELSSLPLSIWQISSRLNASLFSQSIGIGDTLSPDDL